MPKNNAPVVILIRPQMGENIGAVARAMGNFGLSELRLVAPRDPWPNPMAAKMAAGADDVILDAEVYPDVPSAMADIHYAYATTARPRDLEKRVVTPSEAMAEARQHHANGHKVALLFGPERSGLENEDLVACDAIVTIPTSPEKASLNLGQSAVIMGYEWWCGEGKAQVAAEISEPATLAEWQGLFSQFEDYLDTAQYFRVPEKKPIMWTNIQNMLMRARLSSQEVRTLRGALRAVWERGVNKKAG